MKWHPKNKRESLYSVLVIKWHKGLRLVDYPVENSRYKILIIPILLMVSPFWVAILYYENVEGMV